MKKIAGRKERGRKKILRMLSVMLCVCLMVTACPYMPGAVVVNAAGSGTSDDPWICSANGSNVKATLDEKGKLTIYGTGAMMDFTSYTGQPWYNKRSNIQSIEIERESGVTSIGNKAFHGCENLTSVTIPAVVTSIGTEAFF